MKPPGPPRGGPDDPQDIDPLADGSRLLGALAYLPFLCFLPYFVAPHDDFARYHARQGFLLLVLLVVLG
ncbi:MAG TPA: hypothetical protein VIB08_01195, partial [Thermoanaerobaculia bacterium]